MPIPAEKRDILKPNLSGISFSDDQDVNKIIKSGTLSDDQKQAILKPYKCVTCGRRYTVQKGNFFQTSSQLYKSNNFYMPTCMTCIESLVDQYTNLCNSQDEAIKRICLHFDLYYNKKLVEATKASTTMNRIKGYISKNNSSSGVGKTYDTYLNEVHRERVGDDPDDYQEDGNRVSSRVIKRWGGGYSDAEYFMIEDHYNSLKDKIGGDEIKESLVRDLCETYIMRYRARQAGEVDKYEKLSKLYQATLNSANLAPTVDKKNSGGNADDMWAKWIEIVEKHSPAEFIKDEGRIFKDAFEQDEYYRRFIARPTDNLINDKTVMDAEFSIPMGDED